MGYPLISAVFMRLVTTVAALALIIPPAKAEFVIPASASVGPSPANPGTGLVGLYYNAQPTAIDSTDQAAAFAATHAPTASFLSSQIDYPVGAATTIPNSSTVAQFLGAADSASLSPPTAASNTLANSIWDFRGFISIPSPGDVTFALGSDDGGRLTIGEVTLIDVGDRPFGFTSETATFLAAGLYPFDLLYYANPRIAAGVELASTLPGGQSYSHLPPNTTIIPTSFLYSVPEPSSLSLLGVGILILLGCACHRRGSAPA
jgi:hypothetical protein